MPFRREGPDDLIEHRNGKLCEFTAARTVAPQKFAGQREGMHAFERGFFGARYCVVIKKRAGARQCLRREGAPWHFENVR